MTFSISSISVYARAQHWVSFFISLQTWNLLQYVLLNTMRIIRCRNFTGKNLDMFDKNLYMWRLNRLYEGDRKEGIYIWCGCKFLYYILNFQLAHPDEKKIMCSYAFLCHHTRTFTRVADIKCLIFKIQFNSLCLACLRCLPKIQILKCAHRVK